MITIGFREKEEDEMNIANYFAEVSFSIKETMMIIDAGGKGVAFICDNYVLIGVVTDGDIRRYILKNGDLNVNIGEVACTTPITLTLNERAKAQSVMKEKSINAIPIVDNLNHVIEIIFNDNSDEDSLQYQKIGIQLVIMAGGKGTRLRPYTDILPKPLIPIGEKTITEHIINRFAKYDCKDIYMIVNYKKEFIKAYFADEKPEAQIKFIDESTFLGTAGGLTLLNKNQMNDTFFLSNCDILVEADYAEIYKYHKKSKNIISLVCVKKEIEVPYGTVEINKDNQITELIEKPRMKCNINTGLYVIEKDFLQKIPQNTFIHITDIIKKCIEDGERVGAYLIDDSQWMDMGQLNELERMKEKMKQNKIGE